MPSRFWWALLFAALCGLCLLLAHWFVKRAVSHSDAFGYFASFFLFVAGLMMFGLVVSELNQ